MTAGSTFSGFEPHDRARPPGYRRRDGEGTVLVLGGTDTEALGEATPPGPFLARSLVIRPRHDVGQALVGLERTGVVHLGADQDVLVRKARTERRS